MSTIPTDLYYAPSHEWVRDNKDGTVTIGITDHAQEALGDVVYVEVPDPESDLERGTEFALVESVKAASDIYSPVSGVVITANEQLADEPELINESPYEDGWLVKVKIDGNLDTSDLLDHQAYTASVED